MLQVKLPYYPHVIATYKETAFGAIEVNPADVYDTPIEGIRILKIDLLESIRSCVGTNCMLYRDLLYKLVAGSCDSMEEHLLLFESSYRRYSVFTGYVNELFYYGESSIPLVARVLNELRDKIDKQKDSVTELALSAGGKYLLHTHDYLYFGYKGNVTIPSIDGSSVIC